MITKWSLVRIGDVADPAERSEAPVPGKAYRQIGVRLWGQGAYEREILDGVQTKYQTLFRVENGDIVVNKIWARNGSVAVVTNELAGCYGSGEFPIFSPNRNQLNPRWFHWITKASWFWRECDLKSRGTSGKNRIRPEKFLEIQIPLPSVEEQRRIVAKIDELAGKIEETRGLRHQAWGEMELLVQSKISEIIRQKVDSKSWKMALLPDFVAPNRYAIKRGPFGSHLRKEYFVPSGYKVYEQKHAIYGDFNAGSYYISDEKFRELRAFELKPDDLIISCSGTIGKVAIVPYGAEPGIINQALLKITLDPSKIDKRFFKLVFESDFIKKEVTSISPGSAMKNIGSIKILKRIKFPLPHLDEQQHIITYLDGLVTKVDLMKRLQAETTTELDALLPSILDKAFKGEL